MEEYILKDTEFRLFRELIYELTGISLSDAKRQLVQSRLQKRLRHYKLTSFREYYDLVQQKTKKSELTELINCITTNKTEFYREPHHFEFVAREILPEMMRRARRGEISRRIRVWHAGCSTGEEPYTLALTLAEALGQEPNWDVRQLASDIDTQVLAHAERGIYELERIAPVPERLVKKYFRQGTGEQAGYVKVSPALRDRITFRRINLLDDTWPIRNDVRFDMIFCRNVIIYFDKPTQRRLLTRFQEWLRPGGCLFIGHSESLFGINHHFESLGGTIYRLPAPAQREARAA